MRYVVTREIRLDGGVPIRSGAVVDLADDEIARLFPGEGDAAKCLAPLPAGDTPAVAVAEAVAGGASLFPGAPDGEPASRGRGGRKAKGEDK